MSEVAWVNPLAVQDAHSRVAVTDRIDAFEPDLGVARRSAARARGDVPLPRQLREWASLRGVDAGDRDALSRTMRMFDALVVGDDEVRPVSAPRTSRPVTRYAEIESAPITGDAGECAICLDAIREAPMSLTCSHRFHEACFARWGESCRREARAVSCPMCKAVVL